MIPMGAKATGQSLRDHWQTPPYILEAAVWFLKSLPNITEVFDPCPPNPQLDGLAIEWPPGTFINPPFSQYAKWVDHGIKQKPEQIWICHHNHDTRWFRKLMDYSDAISLLTKRVNFIHPENGHQPGSAIGKCQSIVYRGRYVDHFEGHFCDLGRVLRIY
jgi:hypothetical protein